MPYSWKRFAIRRFFGLDEKTNIVDVKDGYSPDAINAFQDSNGVVSKCKGNQVMFASDFTSTTVIDEVGTCVLSGTRYYFQFSGGSFYYSTSITGTKTTITPSPAIAVGTSSQPSPVWWAVLDDKLFFVDGSNVLRFFNGSVIYNSLVAGRPTAAPTTTNAGTGYDYAYTIERTLSSPAIVYGAESPLSSGQITNKGSSIDFTLTNPIGPSGYSFVESDIIRVYRKATAVAIGWLLTDTHTVSGAEAAANTFTIAATAVPNDDSPQLYTDLGLAINKTAPTGMTGITVHYGRLIGWKDDTVYVSKVSNPQSWPDEQAVKEAFVYTFGLGDGEDIKTCVSYRESLFVLKPSNGAIFVGVGPDDSGNNAFAFRRYEAKGNGCIAGKSASVIGEENNTYLVYLSTNGFYATNGNEPTRIGEKVEPTIRALPLAQKQNAVAIHERKLGHYMCFVGPSNARKCLVLDVRKDENGLVGWFKYDAFQVRCIAWDENDNRYLAGTYSGYAFYSRNADTSDDFSAIAVEYVAAASINTGTEEITVTVSYATADPVIFRTSGTIPAGLTNNTTYFAIRVSATVIKLATSAANALAGTAINITTQGVGTHSIVRVTAIDAYYTTNWFNFKSPANVKKLGKPSFIFNAKISVVNIELSIAYDWFPSFVDTVTISITSTHTWGYPLASPTPWGSFVWGDGALASPKNVAIPRRKVRSIRYKFRNATLNQDLNIQGFEQEFSYLRNRGNFNETV